MKKKQMKGHDLHWHDIDYDNTIVIIEWYVSKVKTIKYWKCSTFDPYTWIKIKAI